MRRRMCAAILGLEAVAYVLVTPVLISIADVAWGTATAIGVGLLVACVLVAGMLRRPWAYGVGWAIQAVAILLGFVVHAMFVLGVIFLTLWWVSWSLGGRIDEERAAADRVRS